MSLYPFHALLGRMKYITRWALMRCMRQESLSEHTADTALLAHALCLIARNITHTRPISAPTPWPPRRCTTMRRKF